MKYMYNPRLLNLNLKTTGIDDAQELSKRQNAALQRVVFGLSRDKIL